MIKAIIIDDELDAIESLTWELDKFSSKLEVLSTWTDPFEAIKEIDKSEPDCVFLDIEMPKIDGFQLLKMLNYRNFDLVITTAYDNYAIQAFKESAIDYLLKPIDEEDLKLVIDKVVKNKEKNKLGTELKEVLQKILMNQHKERKVLLPLNGKSVFVKLDDILYCKSDGNYTTIYLINNEQYLISKKIKDVNTLCESEDLIRVHQSYLVNSRHIKEYVKIDGYYLLLEDKIQIPVSKSNRKLLQTHLENIS